jgi:FHA domain
MANAEDDSEKTRVIRRPRPPAEPPPLPSQPPPLPESVSSEKTPIVAPDESDMTRLIGPPRKRSTSSLPDEPEKKTGDSEDPVVGWLVIVSGPGRGNFCRLGYGQNSIGRDVEERVRLDFGDDGVSRKKHCFVIYEPRARQYSLRPGDGANLTYLNGTMLSQARQIKSGDLIEIGNTTLRFVPLCGPDFEWHEPPKSPAKSR